MELIGDRVKAVTYSAPGTSVVSDLTPLRLPRSARSLTGSASQPLEEYHLSNLQY